MDIPTLNLGARAARGGTLAHAGHAVEGDEYVVGCHCSLGARLLIPSVGVRRPPRAPEPCTREGAQSNSATRHDDCERLAPAYLST